MNNKREVLLSKENFDLINTTHMINNSSDLEIVFSPKLGALRRCNSLPVFVSKNMYCDWKKKSTDIVQSRFIARDSNPQSMYVRDTLTLNFDPFNIETETKSLQELQTEVDALIEFRNIVIETFPDLKTKMMSVCSEVPLKRSQSKINKIRRKSHASINGVEVIGEALTSFVSRSRSNSNSCRKELKSGEGSGSTVQDSGFSTETTSSKDPNSAPTSSGGLQTTNVSSNHILRDSNDELLNLLDVIFRKTLRSPHKYPFMPLFERDKNESNVSSPTPCIPNILNSSSLHTKFMCFNTNNSLKQNLLRLNKERDKLLLKVAELESEIIKNRLKISTMEKKLEFFTSGNKNLEEQLKAVLSQNEELHFELLQHKCDSASRKNVRPPPTLAVKRPRGTSMKRENSKFLTQSLTTKGTGQVSSKTISENNQGEHLLSNTCDRLTSSEFDIKSENLEIANNLRVMHPSPLKLNSKDDIKSLEKLDRILSYPKCMYKVDETDSNKIAAILLETNPLELQRHLLTLTVGKQAKRSYSEQIGSKSIPSFLRKKSYKPLLHQMESPSPSHYRYDCDNSRSLEQLTSGEHIQYENGESSNKEENRIDSIGSHDNKNQNENEKTIQPSKRPKPSKIPLFGVRTLHSSKAIHNSLSMSTGNIYFKNSKIMQQDSLAFKTRGSSPSVAADSKIITACSALMNLETGRFLQLDSLAKSKKMSKTNKYIKQIKNLNPLQNIQIL